LGVRCFVNPLGDELIAEEHFWYIRPRWRGISSIRMLKEAERWAKEKGCACLILSASRMAGNVFDGVCRLYERMGGLEFEKSYIIKL
jgi:GNAT superfamily N-acetyltransferase